MNDPKEHERRPESETFLIEEYKHVLESFWRSEELGERRVNFFITLTTAVVAAFAALSAKGDAGLGEKADLIFIYGLLSMLVFGGMTLARIIRRNLESHKYIRAAGRIRRYFADRDEQVRFHLYFEPRDDKPIRKKEWKDIISVGTGGLLETVALVNSLIFAALIAKWMTWPVGLIGFVVAWIAQFIYVKLRYEAGKPKKEEVRFPGNLSSLDHPIREPENGCEANRPADPDS